MSRAKWFALATLGAAASVAVAVTVSLGGRLRPYRATDSDACGTFAVREEPVVIAPRPLPDAIREQHLAAVLGSVQPYFYRGQLASRVPMSLVIHAVKLWGPDSRFPPVQHGTKTVSALDGKEMMGCLLDHSVYERTSQYEAEGILFHSPYGVRSVCATDWTHASSETVTHMGKIGQICGENGVPSARSVRPADGPPGTLADILRDDAARVVPGCELDFVLVGLSRYAVDGRRWKNRFGTPVSFDMIAEILSSQSLAAGTCDGTAKLYAMTTLLRADEQSRLLSEGGRSKVVGFMQARSRQLEAAQESDGSWGWDWPKSADPAVATQPMPYSSKFLGKVLVTGHHLEWMAIAPEGCRPSDDTIRNALTFLLRSWPGVNAELASDWHNYGLISHAARAVWLLSGRSDLSPYRSGSAGLRMPPPSLPPGGWDARSKK